VDGAAGHFDHFLIQQAQKQELNCKDSTEVKGIEFKVTIGRSIQQMGNSPVVI
jgi:hypothetical protein